MPSLNCLLILILLGSPLAVRAGPVLQFLPAGFAASAINSAGHIVGTSGGAAAVLIDDRIVSLASALPSSTGDGINSRDDVTGQWNGGSAYRYVGGVARDVGAGGPWASSRGVAINDSGQVLGNGFPQVGEAVRGFVYTDGSYGIIGTFGGDGSYANAFNNSGTAVGRAALASDSFDAPSHAFVYRNGTLTDLGTFGGRSSEAFDINDAGAIVGSADVNNDPTLAQPHPFLYANGAMTDLGSLGGFWGVARGINSAGLIVGESDIVADVGFGVHGFLYADHKMVDLNSFIDPASGWEIVSAKDISDTNQVLGTACRAGSCVDVRLDLLAAVPEPAGVAMLAGGLGVFGLLGLRRRRRRPHAGARAHALAHAATRDAPAQAQTGAPARQAGAYACARARTMVAAAAALRRAAAVLVALASSPLAAQAAPTYTATFLPANWNAYAINNAGQIAGDAVFAAGYQRGFIWDRGVVTELPTLGGLQSSAQAINASGVAAGYSASGDVTRAFVYANGVMQRLGTLHGGSSFGYGINASGQVAGESIDAAGNSSAFLYAHGTLTDLGSLGSGDARARAINDRGDVVGGSYLGADYPDEGAHAFLYADGAMRDLGTLGGHFSWATAINNAGQVAGYSYTPSQDEHAFLYSDGVMQDIGSFGGAATYALGINNAGSVVGFSSLADDPNGFSHAFLFANGTLQDLNRYVTLDAVFTLTDAIGINDRGQILAHGCTIYGYCAPVLLDPIPEPGGYAMLVGGLLLTGWWRRRLSRCSRSPDWRDESAHVRRRTWR